MVIVGCNETVCVNLVPPGAWTCGKEFNMALEFQAELGHIPKDVALRAIDANKAVLEHLPKDKFLRVPKKAK